MLSLSTATRVFVALEPVDMRQSFNGLYTRVQSVLQEEPTSGHWFVFTNKRRNRVKISDFGFPANPFTRGDVTYHSTHNLTWGSATPFTTTADTLIGNDDWTPIQADIATGPKYDMFGFDIGTFNTSPITINLFTSLATISYPSLTIADTTLGNLDFKGYVLSPGEYFTGFEIIADNGAGNLPGLTHVTLGHVAGPPVPEAASSLSLLGLTLAGMFWSKKKTNHS